MREPSRPSSRFGVLIFASLFTALAPVLPVAGQPIDPVGYELVTAPAGFSLIANPLSHGSNTVAEVLTGGVVDGMVLYKFNSTTQTFSVNVHQGGAWLDPTQTLAPGEGAFLFNPGNSATVTFVGSVAVGSYTNSLPAGLSLVSAMLPVSGQLDTALSFPVTNGDVIYRFNNASGSYKVYTYDFGSWTTPPVLSIGESFFVWKAAATNWVQTYTF